MSLETYRRKRDFHRTPEPRGGRRSLRKGGLRFVIQKHAARRLHYDFRLELDGALKSWAIPKGPSLDPKDRRLAIHVEDHPIEYGKFEGTIPQPEYGAGTVIVWDRGTWHPEGDPLEGYRKGHLKFRLDGEKLRGGFNLIRTRSNAVDKEQWLLVKANDEYASDMDIVAKLPDSVQSGRSLEDVAGKRAPQPSAVLPRVLRPALATLVDRTPSSGEWVHEIKHDGYRVLCRVERGRATLYSRNGNDLTPRMRAIARAIESLSSLGDAWLDGEVVAVQADGRSNFSALQVALSEGRDNDMIYYIFDLPYANGEDYTQEPLLARKRRLAALLQAAKSPDAHLRYSDHVHRDGSTFYREACQFQLEGVISKLANAPYRSGRTLDWLKTKCRLRQEFLVCGYTAPRGSRSDLGALVLGLYDATGQLHYCGRTGTGFSVASLADTRKRLDLLKADAPPFVEQLPSEARKDVTWVRPETVVEIEFAGWTRDGLVRQASFQGMREDKSPREVVHEIAEPLPPPAQVTPLARPEKAPEIKVQLTHPDKVLYPEQGLTKADLAAYYNTIADWVLPYAARRPLTVVRCPDGRHKQCFFQKHATESTPAQLLRIPLTEESGKAATYLAVDSIEGILALVQLGALELHVWGARIDKPEAPDQMVLDFDPDPALPWKDIVEAATLARARLEDLGLATFVRTTGGKGLHVVVPLVRRHTWEELKEFAKAVAEDLAHQNPARYTTRVPLAARRQKIFIDYLRNGRGATSIVSYSTRARPGATVSVPLRWEELTPDLRPDGFTVKTVPERLHRLKRDPWDAFESSRRALTNSMKRSLGIRD